MKLTAALLVAATYCASAQDIPKTACEFDGFDVHSKLAEVKAAGTAYYGCGTGKCLPMHLDPGDPVVITRADGNWSCGYLVQRHGAAQGWVRSGDIRQVEFDPNPRLAAWVGTWIQDGNRIRVQLGKSPGKLALEGKAYWPGRQHPTHTGEFSAEAAPSGNQSQIDDSGCKIDLALIGDYLLANDNNMCGGMNVRFWGVWRRARTSTQRR